MVFLPCQSLPSQVQARLNPEIYTNYLLPGDFLTAGPASPQSVSAFDFSLSPSLHPSPAIPDSCCYQTSNLHLGRYLRAGPRDDLAPHPSFCGVYPPISLTGHLLSSRRDLLVSTPHRPCHTVSAYPCLGAN